MSEEIAAAPSVAPAVVPGALHYASQTDASHEAAQQLTRGDAAAIAVKLVAVYAIFQSLPLLTTACRWMTRGRIQIAVIELVPAAIYVAVGLALLLRTETFARWLLTRASIGAQELPTHAPTQLQAIAFSVIGVLLLIWSLPMLGYYFVSLLLDKGRLTVPPTSYLEQGEFWGHVFSHGIQAVLGLWLFFGSKGLAVWWSKLRHPEFQAHVES